MRNISRKLALLGSCIVLVTTTLLLLFEQKGSTSSGLLPSIYTKFGGEEYERLRKEKMYRAFASKREGPARPNIAWLMSFPNSGTTYTMRNTEQVSQISTATNYAMELHYKQEKQPIRYESDNIDHGPWQRNITLPVSTHVLCKTHCTGYDLEAPFSKSVYDVTSFRDGCTLSIQKNEKDPMGHRLKGHYEVAGLVERAVHIIRDPFDNVVSRMHHAWKRKSEAFGLTEDEMDDFKNSKEGVDIWCSRTDNDFWEQDRGADMILNQEELTKLLPYNPKPYLTLPCHAEFFRYIQWHNLALQVLKMHNISSLTVYYESYETDFNNTVRRIMNHLDQPQVMPPLPFESGKTYRNQFFSRSEQLLAKSLMKSIASNETWALLQPYFSGW